MGNCLVTKLKGVVDNDNLVKLGELMLQVNKLASIIDTKQQTLVLAFSSFDFNNPPKIKVKGNGAIATSLADLETNPLTEYTVQSTSAFTLYLKNDNYQLIIEDKYHLTSIGPTDNCLYKPLIEITSDDIKYIPDLWYVRMSGQTIVENIKDALYLPNLRTFSANNSEYAGNIVQDFGTVKDYLYSINVHDSNAEGTVEGLAAALVASGKTTGSVTVTGYNSQITYQGSALGSQNYTISFNPEYAGGYQITVA